MSSFQANEAGLHEALTAEPAQRAWKEIMDKVKVTAEVTSPIRHTNLTREPHPGHYKESWSVDVSTETGELVGTLENSANYAIFVEHGTSKGDPAQHIALNSAIETLRAL